MSQAHVKLVSEAYVRRRLAQRIGTTPEGAAITCDRKPMHTLAQNVMRRPGFPLPYYTRDQRDRLALPFYLYQRYMVDQFLTMYLDPLIESGAWPLLEHLLAEARANLP